MTRFATIVAGCLVASPVLAQSDAGLDVEPIEPELPTNILLILADDLGAEQVGLYADRMSAQGAPVADVTWTPTLDELASEGAWFTSCWANPVCSPSRAAIHTGKHALGPGGHGVATTVEATWPGPLYDPPCALVPGSGNGVRLLKSEQTLPERLRDDTNYARGLFGKWHLDSPPSEPGITWGPAAHGWQKFQGVLAGGHKNYDDWCRWTANAVNPDPVATRVLQYSTTRIVDDALAWIQSRPVNKPWLCMVSFTAPHEPFQLPPAEKAPITLARTPPCQDPPEGSCQPTFVYEAMVEAMDTEIERLIDGLGLLEPRTLIVFTSDNGTPPEVVAEPFFDAGCTKGKGTPYEGGVRVPLIVRGPGVVPGERTELVHLVDLFNTISEYAGAGVEASLPSRSLKDCLESAPGCPGPSFLYTDSGGAQLDGFCPDPGPGCCRDAVAPLDDPGFFAARDAAGYKLVQYVVPSGVTLPNCEYGTATGCGLPFCYPQRSAGGACGELFFDLLADPFEEEPLDLDDLTVDEANAYADLFDFLVLSVYGPGEPGPWPPLP